MGIKIKEKIITELILKKCFYKIVIINVKVDCFDYNVGMFNNCSKR